MRGFEVVRLVARREILVRVRSRVFLISTVLTAAAVVAAVVVPALVTQHGPRRLTVGLAGSASAALAAPLQAEAPAAGLEITVRRLPDAAAARSQVRDGTLDAAVVDGSRIVVKDTVDPTLAVLIDRAAALVRIVSALEAHGVAPADALRDAAPPPLAVTAVSPPDPDYNARVTAAVYGLILLYVGLLTYGAGVATGVVEEKTSRVIEVLLAAVRPRQLLAGKVLGIGAVSVMQLLVVVTAAAVAALAVGTARVPVGALVAIPWVALWFVLGYALYACVVAAVGASVSRQEDLQATLSPFSAVLLLGYLAAFATLSNPDTPLATVASLVPPLAPLIMPVRLVAGHVPVWQTLLAVVLVLASTYGMIRVAARIYTAGVLRTGSRIGLREAWRAGR